MSLQSLDKKKKADSESRIPVDMFATPSSNLHKLIGYHIHIYKALSQQWMMFETTF
jgi:hypothetical protein